MAALEQRIEGLQVQLGEKAGQVDGGGDGEAPPAPGRMGGMAARAGRPRPTPVKVGAGRAADDGAAAAGGEGEEPPTEADADRGDWATINGPKRGRARAQGRRPERPLHPPKPTARRPAEAEPEAVANANGQAPPAAGGDDEWPSQPAGIVHGEKGDSQQRPVDG